MTGAELAIASASARSMPPRAEPFGADVADASSTRLASSVPPSAYQRSTASFTWASGASTPTTSPPVRNRRSSSTLTLEGLLMATVRVPPSRRTGTTPKMRAVFASMALARSGVISTLERSTVSNPAWRPSAAMRVFSSTWPRRTRMPPMSPPSFFWTERASWIIPSWTTFISLSTCPRSFFVRAYR